MLLRDMREIIGKNSTLTLISDKLALDNNFWGRAGECYFPATACEGMALRGRGMPTYLAYLESVNLKSSTET